MSQHGYLERRGWVRDKVRWSHPDIGQGFPTEDAIRHSGSLSELTEADIVERFWSAVCLRAEENILNPGKLEGAHYAAATEIIAEMRRSAE